MIPTPRISTIMQQDFFARVFRFAEVSRENWHKVSLKVQACMIAFQAGVAMAIIDPHLGFYGLMRFYEARLYGGNIAVAGITVTGLPFMSLALGHNEYVSIAMTTGGPDTADSFKETLNHDNPDQYKYDGKWRDGTRRTIKIAVKTQDGAIDHVTREILYTHHGPVIAEKDGFGYAASTSSTATSTVVAERA